MDLGDEPKTRENLRLAKCLENMRTLDSGSIRRSRVVSRDLKADDGSGQRLACVRWMLELTRGSEPHGSPEDL